MSFHKNSKNKNDHVVSLFDDGLKNRLFASVITDRGICPA